MKDTAPIDWKLLDAEKVSVLEKIVKEVYYGTANENGKPECVTEKLVYRKMGLAGQRLENMPRCKAIFERYTESYPESWARKIIWAYQKLKEEGKPFYWTDIRKISGVKKKNFQSMVPYLMKHTDVETVRQIMTLALSV